MMKGKAMRVLGNIVFGLVLVLLGAFLMANRSPLVAFVGNTSSLNPEPVDGIKLDNFWKVWHVIDERSPDAKNIGEIARIDGAIKGLVSSLGDPYSEYFSAEESKKFEEGISGEFGGLGIELDVKDGLIVVISPLKDSPAERAGIKKGDIIAEADNQLLQDVSINEAISIMRGKPGTLVTLTVLREGEKEPLSFTIKREIIHVKTVDTELRKDGVFVISLYNFFAQSDALFADALNDFAASGSKKLILDLRGNPGGYLESAVNIASWFLPEGDIVVKEISKDTTSTKEYRSKGNILLPSDISMVVLIDRGSASASEILAGALQDHHKAKLVGEKSYGKGSVQEVIDVTKDTILKLTIAHWYTPNGTSISKTGLTPDVEVKTLKDEKSDTQLEKAAEILNK